MRFALAIELYVDDMRADPRTRARLRAAIDDYELDALDGRAVVRVPLYDRTGVAAFALVDPDALSRVVPFRWHCIKPYAVRSERRDGGRRHVWMHREVLGGPDDHEVDHINRDPLDNRRSNLRSVTRAQNAQNMGALGGRSRFRGVSWNARRGRWFGQVRIEGRNRFVGYFDDEVEAAIATDQFRREHLPYAEPDPELENFA